MRKTLTQFWDTHPALYYGCVMYVGCTIGLYQQWWALLFLAFLFSGAKNLRRWLCSFALFMLTWCVLHQVYLFPVVPDGGIEGRALFKIERVARQSPRFGGGWLYLGTLQRMVGPEGELLAKNIPVAVPHSLRGRPLANTDYWIEGKLKVGRTGSYTFKVPRGTVWEAIPGSWGGAEIRLSVRQALARYLRKQLDQARNAALLTSIITGEVTDPVLFFAFGRLGMSHLMAISGFHFSLLALLLAGCFRPVLPLRTGVVLAALLLTAYAAVMGMSPSIARAWLMAMVALFSSFFVRQSRALNSMGVALLLVLVWHPPSCRTVGFGLSFVCTAAILLFYRPMTACLQLFFGNFRRNEIEWMSLPLRHVYLMFSWLLNSLALTLAVHMVVIPLSLFYFRRFPLMGLVFNVFFPPLLVMVIFLFVGAVAFSFLIPVVGSWLFRLVEGYTAFTLNLAYGLPAFFDWKWRTHALPPGSIVCLLVVLAWVAIYSKQQIDEPKQLFYSSVRDLGKA